MLISVCICTFRRPTQLATLLDALGQQSLNDLEAQVELVVVDNDPLHSAQPVLAAWRAPQGFELRYFHVPVPNIAEARNTAIHNASGEWVGMIDDDETPQNDWLVRLIDTQRRFNADAVFGPVVPQYVPATPDWIRAGGYFDRARHATGTAIDERDARTGNVLIRAARLNALPGPFDVAFGRTGGEDSLLFRDLLAKGCSLVWCDEAPVTEEVPLERATAAWLLRRSYRIGQTWIRAELYRLPLGARVARGGWLGTRAVLQLLLSVALALGWALLSRARAFSWVRTAVTQAGKITGMTRFQYQEYGA